MFPEVDFFTTSVNEIEQLYREHGCVLLRQCFPRHEVGQLAVVIDPILRRLDRLHLHDTDLCELGFSHFADYLLHVKHQTLLRMIFGKEYEIDQNTHTRRVDVRGDGEGYMRPLEPHLDAFFHPFRFTANFWVPFMDCGKYLPGLGVVCAPPDEAREWCRYDGKAAREGGSRVWNLSNFARAPLDLETVQEAFGDRVWLPEYRMGDAMLMSNWTLHWTHTTERMFPRRQNVELRFVAKQSRPQKHASRFKRWIQRYCLDHLRMSSYS